MSNPRVTSVRKASTLLGLAGRLSPPPGFVRRNLWLGPVVAMVALVLAATWVRSGMERAIEEQLGSQLQTLLQADLAALEQWLRSEESNAESAADDPRIVEPVRALLQRSGASAAELLQAPERAELARAFEPWLESHQYAGYAVLDRQHRVLAANTESLVGQQSLPGYNEYAERALAGQPFVSRPFPSVALLPDETGQLSAGVPTMFAAAPVLDEQGQAVAVIGLRIRPEVDFTRILNVARFGRSGETYAFDKQGLMLSASRFDDELKRIGLIADRPQGRSVLTLELRDPGVDLTRGGRSSQRRSDQPLTRMAADAVAGNQGLDVMGYRDYRGVEVLGAWQWLPERGFGVAVEIDKAEAYAPVHVLRTTFWVLFGMLVAATLVLLGMAGLARRLDAKVRAAANEVRQLGQYVLEDKIGEGGMGSVYRARHSMLRRPTAVKLLLPDRTSDVAVARFEREVQLTSQLNHPNTIAIYDFGRTPEGVFYYAMEFLEGLSLQALVARFGPQPDGRVIRIVRQVCGSLHEAHQLGLIHRDVKPANILLTQRGGLCDFVKLLDFGLVKAIDQRQQTQLTAAHSVAGTPLYMSPESIRDADQVDARGDLYSLGAVAYFLLTGSPVFDAPSALEVFRHHVELSPVPPSQRSMTPISPKLESLVLRCLAKSPDDRPASAAELAEELATCPSAQPWTDADAERWWREFAGGATSMRAAAAPASGSLTATVDHDAVARQRTDTSP